MKCLDLQINNALTKFSHSGINSSQSSGGLNFVQLPPLVRDLLDLLGLLLLFLLLLLSICLFDLGSSPSSLPSSSESVTSFSLDLSI